MAAVDPVLVTYQAVGFTHIAEVSRGVGVHPDMFSVHSILLQHREHH